MTITVLDRRDTAPEGPPLCRKCWEEIELVQGKGWLHVRTQDLQCSPVCDACKEKPGTVPLMRREFNGAAIEWVNRAFVCSECHELMVVVVTKPRP